MGWTVWRVDQYFISYGPRGTLSGNKTGYDCVAAALLVPYTSCIKISFYPVVYVCLAFCV